MTQNHPLQSVVFKANLIYIISTKCLSFYQHLNLKNMMVPEGDLLQRGDSASMISTTAPAVCNFNKIHTQITPEVAFLCINDEVVPV